MFSSQRWWISFPFLLALAVLLFLGWSVTQSLAYPYDGILNVSPVGVIRELDNVGPTFDVLKLNDVVIAVDGVLFNEAFPFYPGKRAGDSATLVIQRLDTTFPISIRLANPSPEDLFTRLAPLVMALVLWGIGVFIQAFKPTDVAAGLYFLFFATSSAFLIAGASTSVGPPWTLALYGFLSWIVGPIMVHFHLYFPQRTALPRQRIILVGLYSVALIGGLPYLIWGRVALQERMFYDSYNAAAGIFMAVNLLVVVMLLFYNYRHATTAGARGKIRIVVLGGVLSLVPVVILVILPDALFGQTLLPYSTGMRGCFWVAGQMWFDYFL